MARVISTLKQAMQVLKHAAPQEFGVFVQAMEMHKQELFAACVVASATDIMTASGRAQDAAFICQALDECDRHPLPPIVRS